MRLQPLGEAIEIILECAERDVLVLLARAFADRAPDVRVAFRRERQGGPALADIEPELDIESLGDGRIRVHEMKMIERMHAERARPARGLHETLNCGHASLPPSGFVGLAPPGTATAEFGIATRTFSASRSGRRFLGELQHFGLGFGTSVEGRALAEAVARGKAATS